MDLYLYDRLRVEATTLLIATGLVPQGMVTLVQPKPNIPADLALPVFPIAKALNAGNPAEYAQRIADAVRLPHGSLFARAEAAGGFVNLSVTPEAFAQATIQETLGRGAAFGHDPSVGKGEKTIVEFSSPNIAKKMHVGHLRSTVIGNSIRNIFHALGYDVIGDNHLGDWGTQFGYLLASLDTDGFPADFQTDPINALVRIYADFYNRSEQDHSLKDRARFWFRRLEEGDQWARDTWKAIVDVSLQEFARTYQRLGITFDSQLGESYFEDVLGQIVEEAVAKGVARVEEAGAVSVDFGEGGPPSCLLRKTDGATLYQTRDVATCLYRWNTYHPARNIYVVGAEQKLHFQQVFEIVRRMGYTEIADRSVHIPFGAVLKATGERFAARKGEVIFLEEVLDEAVTRGRVKILEQIASEKSEISDPAEIDAVAEAVGIGSVIYSDLFQGPERNIQFDWDTILSSEGNTAPYIQYTHARSRSILRKGNVADPSALSSDFQPTLLSEPETLAVLKQLHRMPHAVREAGEKFAPATVADWTYNLAKAFNEFYHKHKVLQADTSERRQARLALVAATSVGLRNGLALLGIQAPERM
jgi:arginyl-tRNA synthetase